MINSRTITPKDIEEIEARVRATICETHKIDGAGRHVETIEGRISADDFEVLLSAASFGAGVGMQH